MRIKDIIKDDLVTVHTKDSIENALKLMMKENINGLPVVEDDNMLAGMVVKSDIYRFMIQPGHYDACPVEWVMARDVVTVRPDEGIKEAALKILHNHIVAMPVVEKGKVVGVISIEELLRYYSKD